MIRFESGYSCFNYRAVGVAIREQSILLQQAEGQDFWVVPGGRPVLGEPAATALQREAKEELDVEVEVERLLWLVENFFTYDGKHHHELGLYFLMRLPRGCDYLVQSGPFNRETNETKFILDWFPRDVEVLRNLPLLPSFLQTRVNALPDTTEHLVHFHEGEL